MTLSKFTANNLKAILFVTVVLCGIGAWLLASFPVSILPDVTFPRILVIGESGGRPTRMVDAAIAKPLEQAVASVPGVSKIHTQTQRGATQLSIDFNWGTDIAAAYQLVNTRIGEVRNSLPPDTQLTVERMNPTIFPILGLSLRVKGLSQAEVWSLANYKVRPRLTRVPGVSKVVVQGGQIPEIVVEILPQKLNAYHLSLLEVEQAITASNVVRGVGKFDRQFQQYNVLVSGETASIDELKRVVVVQRNGVPITVGQVAKVDRSVQDRTTVVTADGSESVLLNIVRQPDANTVSVTEGVRKELADLKSSLPAGAEIGVFYDQSILIGEAVTSVRDAVLIGAGLAVVVLLLFLGNLRATLVTAIIIPTTVLITFLLMRLSGMTLNLMTLGALAVGIGLVIDDAIVVVENVFRHLSHGEERGEAIKSATTEIVAPMISSTLTTVVVFLPLVLLKGISGAFFTALAVTLVIALLVSLFLALFVSPTLCVAFLKVKTGEREYGPVFGWVVTTYSKILRVSLKMVPALLLGAVALVIGTVFLASQLKQGFMPEMDEGAFVLDYLTPPGTSLAESDRLLKKIDAVLAETPEIKSYSRRTGTELGFAITEPNRGDYAVTLKKERKRKIDDVMDEIRGKIQSDVPGVDVDFKQILQDLIGDLAGAAAPVEVKLFGEDQKQLDEQGDLVKAELSKIKGVADAKMGDIEAEPELTLKVDPVRAGRAGLTPDAIASQSNAALFGDVVTQVLEGDRQVPVRVRYSRSAMSSRLQMQMLPIRSPLGYTLPLTALGSLVTVPGTFETNREDQRKIVSVTAQLAGRDLGSVEKDVRAAMSKMTLPAGVSYTLGGQFQSQAASFQNLLTVLALAIVLVFAVMLFQFRSFTGPLVILAVMPLALFGVALALYLTKTPLNVASFMGAIMLVGIVVKNGILLLDQVQHAESQGSSTEEAVVHAGEVRLRPILMTTLTAILGLVPLGLGLGAGAEMQKPLAIAVIGGLSLSTIFTLIYVPVLYNLFRRKKG